MKSSSSNFASPFWVFLILRSLATIFANFNTDIEILYGNSHIRILDEGMLLKIKLDQINGGGFISRNDYLFGRFDVQMKLHPGDSAGTVSAFYLSSEGASHDEIDFEFLGNTSGEPYTLHTNVYANGTGDREEEFRLWFDPTEEFHNYTILWNPKNIIFYVDDIPIRVFTNQEKFGIPYLNKQRMKIYCSLWSGEWVTQGGKVPTDWSKAPFKACYRDLKVRNSKEMKELDHVGRGLVRWAQENSRFYNYCSDKMRFLATPNGLPRECT